MNLKFAKNLLRPAALAPLSSYRRHPVLWLATYLIGMAIVMSMAVDWLWASISTSR